jgi:hypothetical protein
MTGIPDALASFNRYEGSIEHSLPVFLYRFQYATEADYIACYTNAEVPLTTADGVLHTPAAIKHDQIPRGEDLDKINFNVTLPILADIVQLTNASSPPVPIVVLIYKLHMTDPQGQMLKVGKGTLINRQDRDSITSVLTCQTLVGRANVNAIRRTIQPNCDLVHYGTGIGRCNANRALFASAPVIIGVGGQTIQFAPNQNWRKLDSTGGSLNYIGALLRYRDPDAKCPRLFNVVDDNLIDSLELDGVPLGLVEGATVDIAPNCTRSVEDCRRYGNILNFGGFPCIPTDNIILDSTVF